MHFGSRMSRHKFRRVVLGDRSLWSTQFLGYDSTEENVRRCISRSGKDADLSIVINIDLMVAGSSPLNAFMSECLPAASRWRTLTYIGDGSSTYGSRILRLFLSNRLVLPRLFELRMHASQEHYHSCSNTDFEYGTGWVRPTCALCAALSTFHRLHSHSLRSQSFRYQASYFNALLTAKSPICSNFSHLCQIFRTSISS